MVKTDSSSASSSSSDDASFSTVGRASEDSAETTSTFKSQVANPKPPASVRIYSKSPNKKSTPGTPAKRHTRDRTNQYDRPLPFDQEQWFLEDIEALGGRHLIGEGKQFKFHKDIADTDIGLYGDKGSQRREQVRQRFAKIKTLSEDAYQELLPR